MKKYIVALSLGLLFSCTNENKAPEKVNVETKKEEQVADIPYSVVATLPHDTNSFTEGFLFYNNQLFESTGSPENFPQTKSVFGTIDLKTGKLNEKAELDKNTYFGEGICVLNNKIYQLTYKNQIAFVYDAITFKKVNQFTYANTEGWSLTTDGTNLIMSDGTDVLTYLDATTFKPIKTVSVNNNGYAEDNLNELEYIKGYIYANIWQKNYIVKIDPSNGKVVGILNLSALTSEAKTKYRYAEVLNGIAYNSTSDQIYVTGKLWKNMYELKFAH